MNPHFVFNALNSVQNFILENDTREASKYLTKFARLMRPILENSESPMVPLAREIELAALLHRIGTVAVQPPVYL